MSVFKKALSLVISCVVIQCASPACATSIYYSGVNTFKHPGVLVTTGRLDYVKKQINANSVQLVNALNVMKDSEWASQNYEIKGKLNDGYISCNSNGSNDNGCTAEMRDSTAAYTQALMWYLTGKDIYAENAIAIMNFYSSKLTAGHKGSDGPLIAAWGAEVWPAAAEIIRYTYHGWSENDAQTFATMLKTQHLPYITGTNGNGKNGNWKLSMIDGMLAIAVYTEDHMLFNNAIELWKQWIPAYYYNFTLDGTKPVKFSGGPAGGPGGWNGQSIFNTNTSGVTQETCRDTAHVAMAVAATFNAAETAFIQGVELYSLQAKRLTESLEFLSGLLDGTRNTSTTTYISVPKKLQGLLCSNVAAPNTDKFVPVLKGTMIRAYNAYNSRYKLKLPNTGAHIINDIVPAAAPTDQRDIQWEVLTHSG